MNYKKSLILSLSTVIVSNTVLAAKAPSTEINQPEKAVSTSEQSLSQTDNSFSSKKSEIKASLSKDSLSFEAQGIESDEIEGSTFKAGFGYRFDIGQGVTTTSSVIGQVSSYGSDISKMTQQNIDFDIYSIGIAQKISYNANIAGFILRPYAELGVSRSLLEISATENRDEMTISNRYFSRYWSLGTQLVINQNIGINLSYTKETHSLDDEYELEENGKYVASDYQEGIELKNKRIALGVAYFF